MPSQTNIIARFIDMEDIERSNRMIEGLSSGDETEKQAAINNLLSNPNAFNPVATYVLSHRLLEEGKANEAMFWFYLSQVRARVDANICKDETAKEAASLLSNTFGPAVNELAFLDLDNLQAVVEKVVTFAEQNEETYDRRWINLHGMDAVLSGLDAGAEPKETSEPIDRWTDIKKTTVKTYYTDFIKYAINKEED